MVNWKAPDCARPDASEVEALKKINGEVSMIASKRDWREIWHSNPSPAREVPPIELAVLCDGRHVGSVKSALVAFIRTERLHFGLVQDQHMQGMDHETVTNVLHAMSYTRKETEYGGDGYLFNERMAHLVVNMSSIDAVKIANDLCMRQVSGFPISIAGVRRLSDMIEENERKRGSPMVRGCLFQEMDRAVAAKAPLTSGITWVASDSADTLPQDFLTALHDRAIESERTW